MGENTKVNKLNIKEIRFFNDEVFLLRKSILSSQKIEEVLKGIRYSGQKRTIHSNIENSNIPYFAHSFYYFIYINDIIPNENQLIETYKSINNIVQDEDFLIIENQKVNKNGVINRLLRSYPSLVRDFHFFKLCQESKKFDSVKYSLKKDVFEGTDLIIEQAGKIFCVSIFTKTKRAKYFKGIKNQKRHDYNQCYAQIELPIDLNSPSIKRVSNFLLLSNEHIEELEKMMNFHVRSKE